VRVPEELVAALREGTDFVLATHISPEGDALGSQIALAMALEAMGKTAYLYNRDGVPDFYGFLPGCEKINRELPADTEGSALLLLDCNKPERAAVDGRPFKSSIVVDHHQTESDFGDVRWIEPQAPATGLMVFELLKALGSEITAAVAVNLYAAIAVDTGTFRYNNTTPEVLRTAAELAEAGAAPGEVAEGIYESWSTPRFNLLCRTLGTLELHDGMALTVATQEMFRQTGTAVSDTEEFSNFSRMIRDARVSAFLRELPGGGWKVSLRSKGEHDVARVAERFGGGGHKNAAGCTIEGDLASAKRRLAEAIREIL
jgi:phosphoesterase RecJ-like protein